MDTRGRNAEILWTSRRNAQQVLEQSADEARRLLDAAHGDAVRLLMEHQDAAAGLLLQEQEDASVSRQATKDELSVLTGDERHEAMADYDSVAVLVAERQEQAATVLRAAQELAAAKLHDAVQSAVQDVLMEGQKEAAAILLEAKLRVEHQR